VNQRRAFTLLEVILTLAMSVALMLLIGGAMQFYGRTMNVRDMDVRQIHLASAVMQMIEDDLRATLYTRPVDTAGLEAMLAVSGDAEVGTDEDLSAAGIDSDTPDDSTDDLPIDATILKQPGLIGTQYQIQIDVSRLPRLEEYTAMIDGTTTVLKDIPSDIKTVSYYVQGVGTLGGVRDPLDSLDTSGSFSAADGLVRRSLDRAATVEAALTGGLSRLNQTGDLIAPEVLGVEFAYWDGITWLQDWSSDEYDELPLAIQVQLTMDDPIAAAASANQGIIESGSSSRIFKHVVRLPLARPIDTSEQEELSGAGL
jgi:type II secretory pathway pseudopilin PulG